MIDKFTAQRIKDTANIFDVVRYYNFLTKKKGNAYFTKCPFHDDSHPSLQVGGKARYKNKCHCYVCGAHYDPIGFVMAYENLTYPQALRRLANIVGIIITDTGEPSKLPPPPPPPPPKPMKEPEPTYTDIAFMRATMAQYDVNPLFVFVASLFGRERTQQAFIRYHVGTAKYTVNRNQGQRRSVVYWQVDEHGNVRGGKIMPYNEQTGKRIKHGGNGGADVCWTHTAARLKNYNLHQCLFGQHLIPGSGRINVVESEKTAILASLYFNDNIGVWVATGGKDSKTSCRRIMETAELLAGKRIVLYPDADGVQEWQHLCGELVAVGVDASISAVMQGERPESKFDIGDYIVDMQAHPPVVDGMMEAAPQKIPGSTSPLPTLRGSSAQAHPPVVEDIRTSEAHPVDGGMMEAAPPAAAPERWTTDTAPERPRAQGESAELARERNASMLNTATDIARQLAAMGIAVAAPSPADIRIMHGGVA